jgi:predicted Zn-dependent protease
MRLLLTRRNRAGCESHWSKLAIVWLLLLTTSVAAVGPTQLKPGFNLFTRQQDVQLGRELAAQIRKNSTIVNDPTLNAYVNAIGKRLAATPEARESGFTFTFEVVANPAINAHALPGGPMFINTGLLRAVDNEAQLAGAMAHEMSHVILRHGTSQASKVDLIQLPLALAGQMTDNGSLKGQLTQLGIDLGANSVLLKFSRTNESQADLMGTHLMAEAGYNPIQLAKFFGKLTEEDNVGALQFLADHPNPDNRSRAIRQEAARLPQQTYGYQTGRFQQMKRAMANIKEPALKPDSQ